MRNSLFIRIPRRILPIKAADFVFLGGLANRDNYIRLGNTDKHTRITHIHSMDYEVYLSAKEDSAKLVEGKYCVFLDGYLPYHPDCVSLGYDINPKTYYREINDFLSAIEKKYGVKVVVSLHPRANMDVCRSEYKSFELRKYQTAELVKWSDFVIAHFSAAISFAVLFNKPLLMCTTDSISEIKEFRDSSQKIAELLDIDIRHKVLFTP